jgi:hypothetical protein
LQEQTFQQYRYLFRALRRSRLEVANGVINGNFHDFRHEGIIAQLRVSNMIRTSPDVADGDVHGSFNPFLLRRELGIPA